MEEIIAYRTVDGKQFYKMEDAEEYEKNLGLKKLSESFYRKGFEIFKEFLETDAESSTKSPGDFYFKGDIPIYWEGGEDLEEFVDFLVDVTTSYNGRTLKFMNLIAKKMLEKTK